jgi:chromosome segregation ATPase
MDFNGGVGLPHIYTGRPLSAGATWDLTNRMKFADGRHVRFDSVGRSSRLDQRDIPPQSSLYSNRTTDGATAAQLREQMRQCREEMLRKERLLAQLSSSDLHGLNATQPFDGNYGTMTGCEHSPSSMEQIELQLHEAHLQLERRDKTIHELERLVDSVRESESRHLTTIQQLRRQIADYEQCSVGPSPPGVASTSRHLVNIQNKEANERIQELESRLRTHLDERERMEQERVADDRKLRESMSKLCQLLIVDGSLDLCNTSPVVGMELLLDKTRELVQENTVLRSKVVSLQSSLESVESEQKTNRETILRMINDQQNVAQFNMEMDNLRVERDSAVGRQNDLLTEVNNLKDRLDTTQRAWTAMRAELEAVKSQRCAEAERERLASVAEAQMKAFKECLATMLSDSCVTVEPFEEMIRERLQNIIVTLRDKSTQIDLLEGKLSKMASQLDAQCELNRAADRKTKRAEADLMDMEQKLRRLECNGLVPNDAVRIEQERYVRLLERINRSLGMQPFVPDLSVEGATNCIILRAEQLCSQDSERVSLINSLRHKVKSLKNKLTDKEMHFESLQRRLTSAESRIALSDDAERDKDDVYTKNRKMISLIDKYRCELNEAHLEIRDLKSRLMLTADLQLQAEAKERDVVGLEAKVSQLEHIRQRQADELYNLKESRNQLGEKREETLRSLTEELNRTKFALNDLSRRHRELVDLRRVIARMLGLNVGPATAADFEIVSRIEKLILANRNSLTSTVPVDSSLDQLVQTYRQGQSGTSCSRPRPHTVAEGRATAGKVRSRSMSPVRKRDTKVY